ncbi:MAG: hypothetical protein KKD29_01945 [Candidatus Omnitrophica bacterium]|nr:hypothetical protein [Candidatus Omnitrophota bacterium]
MQAAREDKGVNIPGAHLSFPVITEEDKIDIRFGIENEETDYYSQEPVPKKR